MKGGAEKRIYEIGRRLVDQDHSVTVYSRHWWEGKENKMYDGMQLRAIGPAQELYADEDRRSIPSAVKFAARLAPAITRHGSDHDLFVTPVAPYFHVLTGRFTSVLRGTPLVVTWHEVWNDYWYDYMGKTGVIGKTVENIVSSIPHHAVAPSEMTADKFRGLPGINPEIKVIPNGIDTERVQTTAPAADGFDILFAGRLIDDKNVDLLLDAFDRLDTEATLGIIGDGPQCDALREHADSLKSSGQIDFLGFLEEYDNVLAQMRAAELFVSPSVREGFGITFLEAMAADCTVITVEHQFSAGSEVVGDAGFVTQPTVDDVARAMEQALDGECPPSDPVSRAREFDWDKIATEAGQYFERIVD